MAKRNEDLKIPEGTSPHPVGTRVLGLRADAFLEGDAGFLAGLDESHLNRLACPILILVDDAIERCDGQCRGMQDQEARSCRVV